MAEEQIQKASIAVYNGPTLSRMGSDVLEYTASSGVDTGLMSHHL
jgi:hypothetical protein